MRLQMVWRWYFQIPIYLRLLLTVMFFMFLFGIVIHLVEPDHFPTLFEGLWWAFVTGSTVGYGDYVPVSTTGRIVGILMILAGGGIVTYYMVAVSTGVMKQEKELSKGHIAYRGKNHVIVIGWNERSRQLLKMIKEFVPAEDIVLVDSTLELSPNHNFHFQFIKGDPSLDETLKRANIEEARFVIITSDQSKEEKQADQLSILITVAVRGLHSNVSIITEILTKEQIANAKRAGANTVIRSNDFMSTLFYHEIYREEPVKPFDLILEQLSSQQYKEYKIPNHLIGESFLTCSNEFVIKDELLIGIIRKGEFNLNPPFQMTLEDNDQLITLANLR
ncbi:voltage-gated potassium channel [Salirhabdus euzebyi]|uniref:Voltage-gated potassium channel n=1 Tax=Salirhabdus euzebyi TaxID=394506 RepID=A0A841Q4P4_9BACI|nr:potassium channel family protein [Salirhabdus euzebyi]MBB6453409.1 voltage-gated potassium channel [Salirhabdus euzebyi]